jgi:H/ACA ribonucleoprotein complex subunit 3
MDLYLGNKKVKLDPTMIVGSGGEAEIYKYNNSAIKIFKDSTHLSYQGDREIDKRNREGAKKRLEEYQTKLIQIPPLPNRVIGPLNFIYDKNKIIHGYDMTLINNSITLSNFSEKNFRLKGKYDNKYVTELFKSIHKITHSLHKDRVIMGDNKDLNILVNPNGVFFIDTDSYQFNKFLCHSFSIRFVDPHICKEDLIEHIPILDKPYTKYSDWYAFSVMLFQSLLYVHPYGGVYTKVVSELRPMYRISVFNSEVKYPKFATPYKVLSDDLLDYFYTVFQKDINGVPSIKLLDDLKWAICSVCGTEHSKSICPICVPVQVKHENIITQKITNKIKVTKVFKTKGDILFASTQDEKLLYLYNENGKLKREDSTEVVYSPITSSSFCKYRLHKNFTIVSDKKGEIRILNSKTDLIYNTDYFENYSIFDCNKNNLFYTMNGQIGKIDLRTNTIYSEIIGHCLQNQTQIWMGEEFGFGFYRVGGIAIYFIFDEYKGSVNDSVKLPAIKESLLDSCCFFSKEQVWFFMTIEENNDIVNHCYVVSKNGLLIAHHQTKKGDGSWLGNIRGKSTIGNNKLLVATDSGLVRIDIENSKIEMTKEFKETEKYMDSTSHIYTSKEGEVYIINNKEIVYLEAR